MVIWESPYTREFISVLRAFAILIMLSIEVEPLVMEGIGYDGTSVTDWSALAAEAKTLPMQVIQAVAQSAPTIVVEQNSEYTSIKKRLAERLDELFVTVNTITGDNGIKKAQDEYDKLMRNKTPKSKRK